jgi:hypothetical protein
VDIFSQEVAAGQYLGSGGLTMIGQLVPMMQGVGYATMTIVFWLGKLVINKIHNIKKCLSLLSMYR